MWIKTQNESYVNCDNIYIISVRQSCGGWDIYADSADDKRVLLGTYKTQDEALTVADEIYNQNCCHTNIEKFRMPPENDVL